jgi:TetR/AcrR family transcriptional regulator, regulator of cefoperazone and chloramphenicol sensitivity
MEPNPPDAADHLVQVALDLFGHRGFEGTSTREIARAAGKPMSAITYHFGGKQELYMAVARYLARRIGANLAPALAAAEPEKQEYGPAEARAQIHLVVSTFITMMVKAESASWARYILREQMDPSPAFDELYASLMGPTLGRLTEMVRRVAVQPLGAEEARLHVVALFGQILVFRSCRAALLRSNDWADIGAAEAALIRSVVLKHLDAVLDGLEGKRPS